MFGGRPILVLTCVILASVLMDCSCNKRMDSEVAGRAAKIYYDCLIRGDYESFVDGYCQPERIPDGYRSQLIDNAKMFAAQQQREREGIREVQLLRCTADTATHRAKAFLLLCFGDSTREEVLVPMVEHEGVWMMR